MDLIFFRYYLGTLPNRPDVRHLFRVQDASTHKDTVPVHMQCLSCNKSVKLNNLTTIFDENSRNSTCQFNKATLSKDFSHFVLDCQGPSVPQSFVYSVPSSKNGISKLVKVLDTNSDLQERLSELAMPKVKYLEFNISEDVKTPARVKLLLPPGFRPEEEFTFPLVLKV